MIALRVTGVVVECLVVQKFESAGRHYARAAEVVAQRLPDNLQARVVALSGLGHVHTRQGKLDAALASYTEALELIRRVKPPGDPQIGMTLGNLSYIMIEQGQWKQAKEYAAEAAEIFETSLGPDHPVVARAISNVAVSEDKLGNTSAAYEQFGRALAIREKVLGPDHPDTAELLVDRAGSAIRLGLFSEAGAMLERAHAVIISAHGEDHPRAVFHLLVSADLAEARGDLEAAERLAREAFEKALALEGEHVFTRDAERQMLEVLLIAGRHDEAVEVAQATLERRLARLAPDHELIGEAWVGMILARLAAGPSASAHCIALRITEQSVWRFQRLLPQGLNRRWMLRSFCATHATLSGCVLGIAIQAAANSPAAQTCQL